ncbi:MAG: DUF2796 domain-containing protein [Hyphomicrobiaceae bacterium]
MLNRSLFAIALVGLVVPATTRPVLAQTSAADAPRRQLDAHSHGEGRLAIAIDGKRVELELEVPANDILGFEHAPVTKTQKKALADAKVRLGKPAGLFGLATAAACKLEMADVAVMGAAAGAKGADHGHNHDHDHARGGRAAGGREPAHEHGTHSEIRVTYALQCAEPGKLGTVTFDFFKVFKGSQKLTVTVVGPKGQSSYVVTREKPMLDLSGVS